MTLLSSPGAAFLLEAPLEILHAESMEWLDEISFWKDEAAFFYTLSMNNHGKFPHAAKNKDLEKEFIHVACVDMETLRCEVETHERFLARMQGEEKQDEQAYRKAHALLAEKIYAFEKRFKHLKRSIFFPHTREQTLPETRKSLSRS